MSIFSMKKFHIYLYYSIYRYFIELWRKKSRHTTGYACLIQFIQFALDQTTMI